MVYTAYHCINHYIFAISQKKRVELWILLFQREQIVILILTLNYCT